MERQPHDPAQAELEKKMTLDTPRIDSKSVGNPLRYRRLEELEEGLDALPRGPWDRGRVELIVARTAGGRRERPGRARRGQRPGPVACIGREAALLSQSGGFCHPWAIPGCCALQVRISSLPCSSAWCAPKASCSRSSANDEWQGEPPRSRPAQPGDMQ